MARTLIGNIKGKNGRGITSIKKTGTTGSVDTYTITYTDGTTSTFTVKNSDSIALQRQIVPSAAVESSATASQAYAAGDYVVVKGILRKVKSAIANGNAIGDSNSTATTVTGELATLGNSAYRARNALILTEDVHVSGYAGVVSVRHDGFVTVAERHDKAGFVVDEETFVQVSGILWVNDEGGAAWPALVKAPWQPDDLKDYYCIKIPVEVAKKGAGSVAHRTHFDRDCALYFGATTNGSIVYSGITSKRLFTSTDGYIYIAMHKTKPDTAPAIIYVDTIVPLSSL